MTTALIPAYRNGNNYVGQANYWRTRATFWQKSVAFWDQALLTAILSYPKDRYPTERDFILLFMGEARAWESTAHDLVRHNEYMALVGRI